MHLYSVVHHSKFSSMSALGHKRTFCAATNSLVRSPRQRCALWRAIVCLPLPRVRRTHSDCGLARIGGRSDRRIPARLISRLLFR